MIKYFYNNVLTFDFINKFNYISISKIPNFIGVCLTFQSPDFKSALFYLTFLKIISNKNSKILLSFKKGNYIISKTFIKKKFLNNILLLIIGKVFPYIKLSNLLTFYLHDIELMKNLFKCSNFLKATGLKIIIVFNLNNKKELTFLFKNYLT